jgi:hypothetical protein
VPGLPLRAAASLLCTLALAGAIGAQHAPAVLRPSELPPISDALLAELERQRVLLAEEAAAASNGDRACSAQAFVLFERPRGEVLRMLAATPRQMEYRPELKRLEVIEANEAGDLAEYHVRFLLTTLSYRARHGWNLDQGRVWWVLDPEYPNDLAVLEGLWELAPIDAGRTLGRFTTRIDLGPALPAFLQDFATREKLPDSMEQVRRWVDSGGTWRP